MVALLSSSIPLEVSLKGRFAAHCQQILERGTPFMKYIIGNSLKNPASRCCRNLLMIPTGWSMETFDGKELDKNLQMSLSEDEISNAEFLREPLTVRVIG